MFSISSVGLVRPPRHRPGVCSQRGNIIPFLCFLILWHRCSGFLSQPHRCQLSELWVGGQALGDGPRKHRTLPGEGCSSIMGRGGSLWSGRLKAAPVGIEQPCCCETCSTAGAPGTESALSEELWKSGKGALFKVSDILQS